MMEDELNTVFKALGHPIRRRILDILKQSAKTTGELNVFFPEVTRYAIMKHLTILTESNLVVVRREGKYRRNYLNAVPLQEMHSRWVGKYMQSTASSLLNLRSVVETGGDLTMSEMDKIQSKAFQIEQEVFINAPREKVFKALTEQVGDWWEFRLAPKGVSSVLSLNPIPGGLFIEKWGENEGAVWGNVYFVNAPEEIRMQGHLGMQGAVNSSYTYRLLEKEGATVLQLTHSASGVLRDNWEQSHTEGWQHLLGTLLKNYVEQSLN
jgi:DNA-binding transcriptional ArsR family regulator/uncharacterized protein YndB with AHSA1/START domain